MRVWRTSKEAGRPFPQISQDEVIDWMIAEALAAKDLQETRQAEEQAEKDRALDEWKKDTKGLEERLEAARV